jgi:hypothetical protein
MFIDSREPFNALPNFSKELIIDYLFRKAADDSVLISLDDDGVVTFNIVDEYDADFEYSVYRDIFIKDLIFGE